MSFRDAFIKYETRLREAIHNHPLVPRLEPIMARTSLSSDAVGDELDHYARVGVRLTRGSHPKLFELCEQLSEQFEIQNREIHIFKIREGELENAIVLADHDRVVLAFCDDVLSLIDDEAQLASLAGHELAHAALGHCQDDLVSYLLGLYALSSTPKELLPQERRLLRDEGLANLLQSVHLLSQVQELNADRAGLIACGDLTAAIISSLRLSAGREDRFGSYDIGSYLAQAEEIQSKGFVFEDILLTHPLEPLRAKALAVYHERTDKESDPVEGHLSQYVPVGLLNIGEQFDNPDTYAQDLFMYLALRAVIWSDGVGNREEEDYLDNWIRNAANWTRIRTWVERASSEEAADELERLAKSKAGSDSRTKTAILKTLLEASIVDETINRCELDVVHRIAELMDAVPQWRKQTQRLFGVSLNWV